MNQRGQNVPVCVAGGFSGAGSSAGSDEAGAGAGAGEVLWSSLFRAGAASVAGGALAVCSDEELLVVLVLDGVEAVEAVDVACVDAEPSAAEVIADAGSALGEVVCRVVSRVVVRRAAVAFDEDEPPPMFRASPGGIG